MRKKKVKMRLIYEIIYCALLLTITSDNNDIDNIDYQFFMNLTKDE